jgi:hypothetical protein
MWQECGNLPQSDRQPDSFLQSQSSRQANSFSQTDTTLRAQAVFIHCSSWPAVCTPTQALATQRPQLQLHLQLACTQPSGNGMKVRASNRLASVPAVPPAPASSLAAPLSARVLHGSSPTCEGSNSMHRRPSTLPRTHRALPANSSLSCTKRRPSVSPPVSPLPYEFSPASPVRIHRTVTKEDTATRRPFSGPHRQHSSVMRAT